MLADPSDPTTLNYIPSECGRKYFNIMNK
jgi:hypothetical protein